MSISGERCDLGYNTEALRACAKEYQSIADDLRELAKKLNDCLTDLKNDGWTTGAGAAFQEMARVDWEEAVEKYAAYLDTLKEALEKSSEQYENLSSNLHRLKLDQ